MPTKTTRRKFVKKAMLTGIAAGLSPVALNNLTGTLLQKDRNIGIIGLDTSHSINFTKLINDPDDPEMDGFRVVAAYPYGSSTIESSYSRIPGYIEAMKNEGLAILENIEALLETVDFILLETNDGKLHLEQAMQVFKSGKPMFIDKPVAASMDDALAIFHASKEFNVPVFSASSLRWSENTYALRNGELIGPILGANTYSPATLEPSHPDLFWYGIHGVELLFTVMGSGCKEVARTFHPDHDLVTGKWSDGRIGSFRGIRTGKKAYGGTAFGETAIQEIGPYTGYRPLVTEILKFFRTGIPPVDPQETLEIYAFMVAADESKSNGGGPVSIQSVMKKARILF